MSLRNEIVVMLQELALSVVLACNPGVADGARFPSVMLAILHHYIFNGQ